MKRGHAFWPYERMTAYHFLAVLSELRNYDLEI